MRTSNRPNATMSHALFAGTGGATTVASRYLVEFKAGKMTLQDGWVRPSNKKGTVYVHQSEDNLMHFCWKDRASGLVEDDLIIFPDDCEFKRVPQCTTGRVYLLKFKSTTKKHFFWMQEPKEDRDAELCKKVNDFLNNPPQPGFGRAGGASSAGGGGGGGALGVSGPLSSLSGLGESELSSMFGNISQSELMQLLQMGMQMGLSPSLMHPASTRAGSTTSDAASEAPSSSVPSRIHSSPAVRHSGGSGSASVDRQPLLERPATATAATTSTGSGAAGPTTAGSGAADVATPGARGHIQLRDLQTILTSIQGTEATGPGATAGAPFDLNDVATSEALIPLLAEPEIQQRLLPLLPESADLPRTQDELRRSVQSPQFRQCVSAFGSALRTGELSTVVSQFGVGEEAKRAAEEGNLEAFVRALQQQQAKPHADVEMSSSGEGEASSAAATAPSRAPGEGGEEKMDES